MDVFFRKVNVLDMVPGQLYLPWRTCTTLMKYISHDKVEDTCEFLTTRNTTKNFRVYEPFESKIQFKFKRNIDLTSGDVVVYDLNEALSYRANNNKIYKKYRTSIVVDNVDDVFNRKVSLISCTGKHYHMYTGDKAYTIVL